MKYEYSESIMPLYKAAKREDLEGLYYRMKEGDTNSREKIIHLYLPLVIYIAKKFRVKNKHIDLEDLIQEGNIALFKAVDTWDINYNDTPMVLISRCVRNALINMCYSSKYHIRAPFQFSNRMTKRISDAAGCRTKEDIMEKLGVGKVAAKNVLIHLYSDSSKLPMEKVDIAANECEEPDKCLCDLYELIDNTLEGLDHEVFSMYMGNPDCNRKTVKQICNELNMIEQDVRSIIGKAKTTLRRAAKKIAKANVDHN